MPLTLTADANPGTASWTPSVAVVAAAGQATILNGATTAVVAVGASLNGAEAQVSFAEAPTAAVSVYSTAVAGGNLTIGIDADNTANIKINWMILKAI